MSPNPSRVHSFSVGVYTHVSILEQEFQRRAINVILFGVLASEFNVESKNMNRFAGERT